MEHLLSTSKAIERLLYYVAMVSGWLFVVATAVIVVDVITRNFGFQLPGIGSTRLQELEWHLHTGLFCFWLGAAYIKNAHVRIDIATAHLDERRRALLEFIGILVFALPYCLVAIYFSSDFTYIAWSLNESSDSATGLPWRWIPKSFITAGLMLLLAGVVSVIMRLIVYFWGPERLRSACGFASPGGREKSGAA